LAAPLAFLAAAFVSLARDGGSLIAGIIIILVD